jgi:hypothetical protein
MRGFFRTGVSAGAALALAATGCQSSGGARKIPSSSAGVPEVTVHAKTANEVKAVAADFFRNRGYTETASRHAYEMVFDKPSRSGRSSKALRVRLRLNKQLDGTWTLVGTPLGVEAWRSDLESEIVLPQGARQIHGFLREIKNRVESGQP